MTVRGVEAADERRTSEQRTTRRSAPRPRPRPRAASREAEAQLEKELRSGYRVVVAFESRGEAERARYNLNRLDARLPRRAVAPTDAAVAVRRGAAQRRLRLARAAARGDPVPPARPPAPRAPRRRRRAADSRASPTCGSATTSSTRTTGSPASPASRRRRSPASPATTSSSSTAARTRSSRPPTSSRRSPATSAPAASAPQLSALGSKRWDAVKARARRAARELAGELLNLYAERQARRGHAFAPDGEWQLELERSFPYRETADQIDAIEAVKGDMESERPMDRLICGDVGYGKTEVALRAAHKAAAEGKQVMMLVPTTILAQQHLGTFRERLADLAARGRDGLAAAQAGRGPRRARRLRRRQGRRPDRHPPAALARRPRQGPRAW